MAFLLPWERLIISKVIFAMDSYIEVDIDSTSSILIAKLINVLEVMNSWTVFLIFSAQMFGQEASKILNYIECFPDGAGKGRKMAKMCEGTGIEGFPTWVIRDKVELNLI